MAIDTHKISHGVLAVALDDFGCSVLEQLATRKDVTPSQITCCSYETDNDSTMNGTWQRLDHENLWQNVTWSQNLGDGLMAAVREALSVEKAIENIAAAQVALVIVGSDQTTFRDELGAHLVEAVRQVRYLFFRVQPVFLVLHGAFYPGPDAHEGRLARLPFTDWSDEEDPFDTINYVILVDDVTPEGLAFPDTSMYIDSVADAIFHVTLGRLATELQRQLNMGAERMERRGHFISLGAAELRTSSEALRDTLTDYLFRRLGGLLVEGYTPDDASSPNGNPPDDEFLRAIRDAPQQPEGSTGVSIARTSDYMIMERRFKESDWDISVLENMSNWREHILHEYEQEILGDMIQHDGTAAHRFALRRTGLEDPEPDIGRHETKFVPNETKIHLFILFLIMGGVLSLGTAVVYRFSPSIYALEPSSVVWGLGGLAVVCITVAVMIAMSGLKKKIEIFHPPSPPPPLPEDVKQIRRQQKRRATIDWISTCHTEKEHFAQNLRKLDEISRQRHLYSSYAIALPDSLCEQLLIRHNIGPHSVVQQLKSSCNDPLSFFLGSAETLTCCLRQFARKKCQELDSESIVYTLWQSFDSATFSDSPVFDEMFKQLYTVSLPRIRIWGEDKWTMIALPNSLSAKTRDEICKMFPKHVTPRIGPEGEFFILQITQGFMGSTNASDGACVFL